MPKIANPHKQFQFSIELPGLDPFLAQEVILPDDGVAVVEHGDVNFKVKTAGLREIGVLKVKKLQPGDTVSKQSAFTLYFRDWIRSIQDTGIGGGAIPDAYKVSARVVEYATDGVTPIAYHKYKGVFPSKINGKTLSRTSSDNTIDDIEFQLDEVDYSK